MLECFLLIGLPFINASSTFLGCLAGILGRFTACLFIIFKILGPYLETNLNNKGYFVRPAKRKDTQHVYNVLDKIEAAFMIEGAERPEEITSEAT